MKNAARRGVKGKTFATSLNETPVFPDGQFFYVYDREQGAPNVYLSLPATGLRWKSALIFDQKGGALYCQLRRGVAFVVWGLIGA